MPARPGAAKIRGILLDVEGTTTPIDFVYGTLFPFARAGVEEFLTRHFENDEVAADVEALRRERAREARRATGFPEWSEDTASARIASVAAYFRWLMDQDHKFTALKSLQGKIWEAGYRSGELRGAVYPDVPPAFARWRAQKRRIAIFSSGNVLAQKLLFGHSAAGDLTPFIGGYFDTSTGLKQEAESYGRIASALALPPAEVAFLSDVIAELDAAGRTGMHTLLCVRGVGGGESGGHAVARTFDDVFP